MNSLVLDEAERLKVLRDLRMIGTPAEPHYDAVCANARALFSVPCVLISLVDADRQWFKAKSGFVGEETGRDVSFCAHTIRSDTVMVVEDATKDPRFAANPLVTGEPRIRFYAAAPLELKPGARIGALCLIDYAPRTFSPEQIRQLEGLATIVVAHLRLRETHVALADEIKLRAEREARLEEQATALRETNRLLDLAEQMAQAGHWRLELPTRRRMWSKEVYRIFGLDPDQSEPSLDAQYNGYHPDDRARVEAILAEAIRLGQTFSFEARIVRPDGVIRYVEARGLREHGPDGAPEALFGVVIDVTDLRRTQANLSEIQNTFDILASGAKDYALYILDPDGLIVNWNAGAQAIKGYEAKDVLGEHFSLFYTKEDRDANLPGTALRAAQKTGRFEAEGWRLRQDGSRFWAHVVIRAISNEDGVLTGFAKITRDVTDRREAERSLRASEARYRMLAENATDMIVQIDLDGRRVFVSPASVELLGYAPEELLATRPSDGIHAEDVGRFNAMMEGLRRGERDRDSIINRLRRKDGTYVWVEARWRLTRDARGAPAEFIVSVRDFTARRAAEEALRQSEALYRTLAEGMPQLVWIMTAGERRMTYANRQFHAFAGAIGETFADRAARVHPDDRGRQAVAWEIADRDGLVFTLELRLRRRDGVYRWHKLVVLPLRREGVIVEWLGTALDIDEIIAARQRLQDTTDLLSLAQEAAGAGMFDLDLSRRAVVLSRESLMMHGLPPREAMEISFDQWSDIVSTEDGARAFDLVKEACDNHATYSAEFRVARGDAAGRWIHGVGRAHYDADGRAYRMIGLNFDVTERKAAEALLIEARAAAESARRAAEEASEAKSDFLASMSHEIRTPLNSIIGYADLLLEQTHHRAEDRRKLALIQESGSALLTVVNDILAFSRIEAGQVDLDPAPFRVAVLVDNVVSMVSGAATAKGLWIRKFIAPDVPTLMLGDMDRLRQILLNLMNNAVKFTLSGGVSLDIERLATAENGVCVRFTVRDTGIGISRDAQERLFKRFSQGDTSITRRFGGTGLGLAISKRLVELMDGEIGVDSREGHGAAFWFKIVLPLAAEAEPVAAEAARAKPRRAARVLLVEDVAINRGLACAVLEAGGHRVDAASNGLEAIRMARESDYDIILMDVQMPEMDGLTATKHIRAMDHRARDLPIIAMTANVLPRQIASFMAAGMNDHVGKPFKRAELYDVIERWVTPDAPPVSEPDDSLVIDIATITEMRSLIGRAEFDSLVRRFAAELRGRFGALNGATDRARLIGDVHAMSSPAGLLGFSRLSTLCQEIQMACHEDRDITVLVERLDRMSAEVLRAIGILLSPEPSASQREKSSGSR